MEKKLTLEELLEDYDPNSPSKSLQQLLAENPQQKGGLAQLAQAEKDRSLLCTKALPLSEKKTSKL